MDFSITNLVVVPTGNTLPTQGDMPHELDEGQVGLFDQDYGALDPAITAADIKAEPYLWIAQGRDTNGPLPSDRSKFSAKKVKEYVYTPGSETAQTEKWEIGDFSVHCDEDIILSINAHSYYLDTGFSDGLTRSIVVKAPCCDCGDDPCTEVDAEGIVDDFIAQIDADESEYREAVNLKQFFTFTKSGTGATTKLVIETKPLDKEGNSCDLRLNPYQYDRIWFRPFITKSEPTTADFRTGRRCDEAGTTTLVQRSTFPRLTGEEVALLEKQYYSYKVPNFKELFGLPGYNPYFNSLVDESKTYNSLYIRYDMLGQEDKWQDEVPEDEVILILYPNDNSGDIKGLLDNYLGDPVDDTGGTNSDLTFP